MFLICLYVLFEDFYARVLLLIKMYERRKENKTFFVAIVCNTCRFPYHVSEELWVRLLVVPGDEAFGPEGLPVGLIEEKCIRHLKKWQIPEK